MKLISVIFAFLLAGCQTTAGHPQPKSFPLVADTIQLLGPLYRETLKLPITQIGRIKKNKPVNIYIYSLSGDPADVMRLIDLMDGRITNCYADAAVGPAFTLLQSCTHRMVAPMATLGQMMWRETVELGTADQMMKTANDLHNLQERAIAIETARLDLPNNKYREQLVEGLTVNTGLHAKEIGAADAVGDLRCDTLSRTTEMTRHFSFKILKIDLAFTQCPTNRQYLGSPYPSIIFQWFGVPMTKVDPEH